MGYEVLGLVPLFLVAVGLGMYLAVSNLSF